MSTTITLTVSDRLTPALGRLSGIDRQQIMRVMGAELRNWAQRTHRDPGYRMTPWAVRTCRKSLSI